MSSADASSTGSSSQVMRVFCIFFCAKIRVWMRTSHVIGRLRAASC